MTRFWTYFNIELLFVGYKIQTIKYKIKKKICFIFYQPFCFNFNQAR